MKKLSFALTIGASALVSISGVRAATVSAAGTLVDLTPATNFDGDIADLDSQGRGSDGFVVFNTLPAGGNVSGAAWDANSVINTPAYVTALVGGASAVSSGGWANYDEVTLGGTTYNTGGINVPSPAGTESAVLSFQLTGAVPSTITIGLLTDNSDGVAWASRNTRIEGPGAITANQSLVPNGGSDLVQFDIIGGAAGETYTIFGTSNGSGALYGALTFDSIPEPGSMALFATGIALIFQRRRRS